MNIFIDDNGNASITEIWNCNVTQCTEVYHPYYNLVTSKISNLSVTENSTNYTTLSSWKTSGTLSDKAYKCGINKISNGIELCWGISSCGSHTYTVKYNVSNFVSNLTDSVGVWGYGNYGRTAYVYNEYIEMQSSNTLDSNEYMTILVQFP